MPRALQHEYPRWETDPNDPTGDADFVYPGRPRFVSKQRARKLRKRGVPLMPCHRVHDPHGEHRPGDFYPTHGDRARYAWFEPEAAYEARRIAKLYRDRLRSWQRMGERIVLWARHTRQVKL